MSKHKEADSSGGVRREWNHGIVVFTNDRGRLDYDQQANECVIKPFYVFKRKFIH